MHIYIRVGPVHASDQCRRQHACHTMYTLSSDIVWMYSCRAVRLTLATLQNDLHSCAVTAEANDLTLVVTNRLVFPQGWLLKLQVRCASNFSILCHYPAPADWDQLRIVKLVFIAVGALKSTKQYGRDAYCTWDTADLAQK